jgi:hypothetical protein
MPPCLKDENLLPNLADFFTQLLKQSREAQFIAHGWGDKDKVDYGIKLSYRPGRLQRLAGWVSTEVTFWHSAEYGIAQKSLQKSKNSAEFRVGGIPWTPYWQAGTTTLYVIVDFIPQKGTMNFATGLKQKGSASGIMRY